MKATYDHPYDVLRFCRDNPDSSLVVITSVHGGAMRSKGTLMAVSADKVAGYVSNGCVDADIVMRARQKTGGHFVYGESSPYRDIVLPCGGRIDLAIFPSPDRETIMALFSELEARHPAEFYITSDFRLKAGGCSNPVFRTVLKPKLRLRIAGRGEALIAMSQLAEVSGFDVILQSPEELTSPYTSLHDPENVPNVYDDDRTAVILLFHDHDWEPCLLKQALEGPAFYIGAMGSEKTHLGRCERLRKMGVEQAMMERIRGPIGLLPAMRNANLLAVSVLAEIVKVAQVEGLL